MSDRFAHQSSPHELRQRDALKVQPASAKATRYGLQSMSVDGLIAADDIDLVLNVTVPAAHTEVSLAAKCYGEIAEPSRW